MTYSSIWRELFPIVFLHSDLTFILGNHNSHLIDSTVRDSYCYSTQPYVSLAKSCYILESLIPKFHSANTPPSPSTFHFLVLMKSALKLHWYSLLFVLHSSGLLIFFRLHPIWVPLIISQTDLSSNSSSSGYCVT